MIYLEAFGGLCDSELDELCELVQSAQGDGQWGWAAAGFFRALDLALAAEICRRQEGLSGKVRWRPRALADMPDSELERLQETWEDASTALRDSRQQAASRFCSRIVQLLQQESLRRSAVLLAVDREMSLSYGERWATLRAS